MRILTYKRTHTGDPDATGSFGASDCMGKVRSFRYDAVIGVSGTGSEPRSHGIDGKITWVGISPRRSVRPEKFRAHIVKFDHFVLLDQSGPFLAEMAPALARKLFSGRRFILDKYSPAEYQEARRIVDWALTIDTVIVGQSRRRASCGPC